MKKIFLFLFLGVCLGRIAAQTYTVTSTPAFGQYNTCATSDFVTNDFSSNCAILAQTFTYRGGICRIAILGYDVSTNLLRFRMSKCDGSAFSAAGRVVVYDGESSCASYSAGTTSVDMSVTLVLRSTHSFSFYVIPTTGNRFNAGSATINITVTSPPAIPMLTHTINSFNTSNNSWVAQLSWSTLGGATDYEVVNCGSNTSYPTTLGFQNFYLLPSSTYSFKIRAHNANGYSNYSSCYPITTPAAPQPVIAMEDGSNGNASISNGSMLNLPTVNTGSFSTKYFRIRNNGDAALQINNINLSNTNDFSFSNTPGASIAVGGNPEVFTVKFNPLSEGQKCTSLSFSNNTTNNNPFSITLCGTATVPLTPKITVTNPLNGNTNNGTTFGIGDATQGTTLQKTFTIRNDGNAPLTVGNITSDNPSIFRVVTQPNSTLSNGATTTFTIAFSPTSLILYNGTLSFTTNDPDRSNFTIRLTGTGVAPALCSGCVQ